MCCWSRIQSKTLIIQLLSTLSNPIYRFYQRKTEPMMSWSKGQRRNSTPKYQLQPVAHKADLASRPSCWNTLALSWQAYIYVWAFSRRRSLILYNLSMTFGGFELHLSFLSMNTIHIRTKVALFLSMRDHQWMASHREGKKAGGPPQTFEISKRCFLYQRFPHLTS